MLQAQDLAEYLAHPVVTESLLNEWVAMSWNPKEPVWKLEFISMQRMSQRILFFLLSKLPNFKELFEFLKTTLLKYSRNII